MPFLPWSPPDRLVPVYELRPPLATTTVLRTSFFPVFLVVCMRSEHVEKNLCMVTENSAPLLRCEAWRLRRYEEWTGARFSCSASSPSASCSPPYWLKSWTLTVNNKCTNAFVGAILGLLFYEYYLLCWRATLQRHSFVKKLPNRMSLMIPRIFCLARTKMRAMRL